MNIPDKKDSIARPIETSAEQIGPRERILQAALELFVKKGYFNTNIPDISKLSRCSVGSIYHHFLNKEEIADQLYRTGIQQFREALCSEIDLNQPLKSNVQRLVIAFLTFAEANHMLSRYLWLSRHSEYLTNKVSRPTGVGFDQLGRLLTKAIKNAIRKGDIPVIRADIFWSIVFGIPLSYVSDWLDGFTSAPPRDVAQVLASACWTGLQGTKV